MSVETIVVVGGGLAAGRAVEAVRERGYDGRLVLVAAEPHLPYERPPLSKGYLVGNDELETVYVHAAEWYDEHHVEVRHKTRATALDLDGHTLTAAGEQLRFDRLLLATGCTPRPLAAADASGAPVAYLRTIEDSQRIKAALRPGRSVVVIGGGWIGLEVAAAARIAGCPTTVVEALELPLVRVLGREVAQVFADLHREQGVDLRTSASVESVHASGEQAVVRLGDGTVLTADLLVVGVGVAPDVGLAEAAGLRTDNGVVVDEQLRTSHPDVFAAGDVANAFNPRLGRHVRVEHWDNAREQGATAGRNLLDAGETYDRLPYFFTDQYDLGMEYVGSLGPDGYDEVVLRGDVPGRVFTAFWLHDGAVAAGMHVNDWDAVEPVRRVVESGTVDLSALRDQQVPLDRVGEGG
jgi:3-phenylpropionate/trans-cinnamate dioxygenase ferredoxin reductase subunit